MSTDHNFLAPETQGVSTGILLYMVSSLLTVMMTVCVCVVQAETFRRVYVPYCKGKEQSNALIAQQEATRFFRAVEQRRGLSLTLQSYLIKPVQRMMKYTLLLRQLLHCYAVVGEGEGEGAMRDEIKEALEVMEEVPKRANDIIHLSMLEGGGEVERLGDVLLQDPFTVWDPKQLIKKGRDRQLFLFDLCVLFSKKVQDSSAAAAAAASSSSASSATNAGAAAPKFRYVYKHRLMVRHYVFVSCLI